MTRLELATELPLVDANGGQLREVVFNLINNAVEAMSGHDEIRVSVQDSGPGIDPRQLENVFSVFVATKADGTGLGLAICRMIVEGHGGQLTCRPARAGRCSNSPCNRACGRWGEALLAALCESVIGKKPRHNAPRGTFLNSLSCSIVSRCDGFSCPAFFFVATGVCENIA